MSNIIIKGFNPDRLEELAKEQTSIYNNAVSKLPDFEPAKVEDTIKRFKRGTFDQSRMFYAYEGEKLVGYSGLTGRDKELNLRSVGYPWLAEGTPNNVRDLLYEAMEAKCLKEGTSLLRVYGSPRYPEQLNFFRTKNFHTKVEFLVHQKDLKSNDFKIPEGYLFRNIKKEDLPVLEEVSRKDPKMKSPFIASDFEQFMDSSDYDSESIIVAEKDGVVIGYYALYIPKDQKNEKCFFAGVAIHGDYQEIESYLLMELENRALKRGKKKIEIIFYPDSPRLPFAKERGFKEIEHSFRLEKILQ